MEPASVGDCQAFIVVMFVLACAWISPRSGAVPGLDSNRPTRDYAMTMTPSQNLPLSERGECLPWCRFIFHRLGSTDIFVQDVHYRTLHRARCIEEHRGSYIVSVQILHTSSAPLMRASTSSSASHITHFHSSTKNLAAKTTSFSLNTPCLSLFTCLRMPCLFFLSLLSANAMTQSLFSGGLLFVFRRVGLRGSLGKVR